MEMAELVASRCEAVLGFLPSLQRPNPRPGETGADLTFSSRKLQATGFLPMQDHASEIDATLRLCFTAFGKADRDV